MCGIIEFLNDDDDNDNRPWSDIIVKLVIHFLQIQPMCIKLAQITHIIPFSFFLVPSEILPVELTGTQYSYHIDTDIEWSFVIHLI